jgi:hypothetical protein
MAGLEPIDTAEAETDPQTAIGRCQQCGDVGRRQRLIRRTGITYEAHSVEAEQPGFATAPKCPVGRLRKGANITRRTLDLSESPVIQLLKA